MTQKQPFTTAEVAAMFRVNPGTAASWAKAGKVPAIRTPGGHWRFPEDGIRALIDGDQKASA
ncbi:helix-turn-helix domain-containing protein [Nonomuraea sp. NPDC023979]|uniref:helix-turn-helix domain-containing protein n=1 Tax=Nonomuraea sp. NPDC023979 TaxID=3154796 RepID=UPI0033DF671D